MQAVLFLSIFLITVSSIHCSSLSICEGKMNCDSCIGVAGCSWCKQLSFNKHQRCNTMGGHEKNGCPFNETVEAQSTQPKKIESKPISKEMRITPQKVFVEHLAAGKEVTVNLSYNDRTDKPLDLYYVMDLSFTMADDKDTVSKQAENLANALRQITSDVRLGFGSFIDKPVLPFVASSQLRDDPSYDIPYGFKNWLKLTDDVNKFSETVKKAKISRNLDSPEGTLDALMQAITCTDEIGWRNTSRKLIVVATDGQFHIAGDGKLGGIVRPNDMKCHMENNKYTHSEILDYPSIGEINAVILRHKVYVIFAVSNQYGDGEVFNVYKELEKHVSQSAAERLTGNSSNVVQIIKKKYNEISKKVELSVEQKPDYVDVDVLAKCSPKSGFVLQKYCTEVNVGTQIDFQIKIKLRECPENQKETGGQIVISFFELTSKEKLQIQLNYECSCTSCNQEIHESMHDLNQFCNGPTASKHISCGTCICQEGRYGSACQCSDNGKNNQGNTTNCINPKDSYGILCSKSGYCKCGQCDCPPEYNGKYCEDSTSGCGNQKIGFCSGHGVCVKGVCKCYEGYNGRLCECEESREKFCVEPGKPVNSPVCNGHGACQCKDARCECNVGYGGSYCELCKTVNCPQDDKLASRCQDEFLRKCVRCYIEYHHNPSKNPDQCNELCDSKKYITQKSTSTSKRGDVSAVEFVNEDTIASLSGINRNVEGIECDFKLNSTPCFSQFRYAYQRTSKDGLDILQVYYKPDGVTCNKEPPYLWYIFSVILSVLLLGIFSLLIWKLATHIHDTREFQRFEKETKHARWGTGDNPLYQDPMREFQNPSYRD